MWIWLYQFLSFLIYSAIWSFFGCFIVFVFLSLWCWGFDVDLIVSVPEFSYLLCHLFILWLLYCICLTYPLVLGAWCGSDCITSWPLLFTLYGNYNWRYSRNGTIRRHKSYGDINQRRNKEPTITKQALQVKSLMQEHRWWNRGTTLERITKTCLYNFAPLNSNLYTKTWVYRGIHYFSYFCTQI